MYKLFLTNDEFKVIEEILRSSNEGITAFLEIKGQKNYSLLIENDKSAELLSEKVQDILLYKGFNSNYDPNHFGTTCELLIDKFHAIGW